MSASLEEARDFRACLKMLMDKHEHSVEDVAQLANTCAFVVREWIYGKATPELHIRRAVLNSLDDPDHRPNRARGFLGVRTPWDRGWTVGVAS